MESAPKAVTGAPPPAPPTALTPVIPAASVAPYRTRPPCGGRCRPNSTSAPPARGAPMARSTPPEEQSPSTFTAPPPPSLCRLHGQGPQRGGDDRGEGVADFRQIGGQQIRVSGPWNMRGSKPVPLLKVQCPYLVHALIEVNPWNPRKKSDQMEVHLPEKSKSKKKRRKAIRKKAMESRKGGKQA